jgi:hypothetical protein
MSQDLRTPSEQTTSVSAEGLGAQDASRKWWWLLVPVGYAVLEFLTLFVWWHVSGLLIEPTPGAGPVPGLVSRLLLTGAVSTIVLLLALAMLPRIQWRHALYISVAAVIANWITAWSWILTAGPSVTNGSQVLLTAGTFALVLLVGSLLIRRVR